MTQIKSTIRKASEGDFSVINALIRENYLLYHKNIPEFYKKAPKKVFSLGTYLNLLEDKNTLVIVAILNEEIVGVLYAFIDHLAEDDSTYGLSRSEIYELSVKSKYRRQGVGSELLIEAEKWSKLNKADDISAICYGFNNKAMYFYKNNMYDPYSIKFKKRLK